MSLDQTLAQIIETQQELRSQQNALLGGTGGGNGGSALEQRVGRLEGRMDKVSDDLGAVKVQLATLTERVAHLPSKEFIVSCLLGTLGAIAALVTFGQKLQSLVG